MFTLVVVTAVTDLSSEYNTLDAAMEQFDLAVKTTEWNNWICIYVANKKGLIYALWQSAE